MSTDTTQDPARDGALAALLAGVDEPPALAAAEWDGLRARITAQAELPLARRRRARRFGGIPLRPAASLAAAAAVAAVVLASTLGREEGTPLSPEESAQVERAVEATLPESVELLVSGEAAQGALLEAVVGS